MIDGTGDWGNYPACLRLESLALGQTIRAGSDGRGVPFLAVSSQFWVFGVEYETWIYNPLATSPEMSS